MKMSSVDEDRDEFKESPYISPHVRKDEKIYDLGLDSSHSSKRSTESSIHSSSIVRGIKREATTRHVAEIHRDERKCILYPWTPYYKIWSVFILVCAIFTAFFETHEVTYGRAGLAPYDDASSIIDYVLTVLFLFDIILNFNKAVYDEEEDIVEDRKGIAKIYMKKIWKDLLGIFPFYEVALSISGELGKNSRTSQYLAILRLFRLFRLHRVTDLFSRIQYNTKISLLTLTLIRNFTVALVWAHLAACIFYFIARQYDFNDDTWIGGDINDLTETEKYMTTLYWSIVTFTTVGYGDFSPVNTIEQLWCMVYMLINIVIQSWIIGSITLVIVKNDEVTGNYRQALETLDEYSRMHAFPKDLRTQLKTQLKLDFDNREISDEKVLQHFPTSVRRILLRRLYLSPLIQTKLMHGVRQQFVDEFLSTCLVEIYGPGEDILTKKAISSHLYLLVEGTVVKSSGTVSNNENEKIVVSGFINHFGFFTESPELENVRSSTICKTLAISRSAYKLIAQDHPGSAGKILKNLLQLSEKDQEVELPQPLNRLRAGSLYFEEVQDNISKKDKKKVNFHSSLNTNQNSLAKTKLQDLVRMHISKQNDDHTTRFLYAASRGDTSTMSIMIDQGFDANSADYDSRTALMVAAMKGNKEVIEMLLEYNVDLNLRDMHGTTALFEASRNGHDSIMEELIAKGAKLCMKEGAAASTLCQAIYEGDVSLLRQLLKANIDVNAADYDKRTAAHIASAEGNVAALKVLVEFGADLDREDRWGNNAFDEAKSAKATLAQQYLSTVLPK